MATDKQIAANRRNALVSTGPRSLAGKQKSSQNSLKHGLTAARALLPGESEEEFRQLRGAMFSTMCPEGALENQLLEHAIELVWRLRRVPAFEIALLEWTAHYQAARYDGSTVPVDLDAIAGRNDPDPYSPQPPSDLQDRLRLGRVFDALLSHDLTGRLSRYENSLQRRLSSTLKEFREMQKLRIGMNRARMEAHTLPQPDNDEYVEYKGRWVKRIGPP